MGYAPKSLATQGSQRIQSHIPRIQMKLKQPQFLKQKQNQEEQ